MVTDFNGDGKTDGYRTDNGGASPSGGEARRHGTPPSSIAIGHLAAKWIENIESGCRYQR